uniref:Uncharacterized protein n=1 Tax=Plectus sambesii TaxID=2011161 RepID=A0A914VTG6_9BILA
MPMRVVKTRRRKKRARTTYPDRINDGRGGTEEGKRENDIEGERRIIVEVKGDRKSYRDGEMREKEAENTVEVRLGGVTIRWTSGDVRDAPIGLHSSSLGR